MSGRPKISAKVQVSIAIRQAHSWVSCPLCMVPIASDEPRVLEHMVPRATRIALGLDPDAPEILAWVHKACADRKTNGNKATCADGDIHKIAKAKRIAAKSAGTWRKKSRAIRSAGFRKHPTLKQTVGGAVVAR